jgi:hypothetical protein
MRPFTLKQTGPSISRRHPITHPSREALEHQLPTVWAQSTINFKNTETVVGGKVIKHGTRERKSTEAPFMKTH